MSIKDQLKKPGQPGSSKKITGADLMALERFAEDTRHMIVFDVFEWECPVGGKGERIRIFLSDDGYEKAKESEKRGEMKIVRHARICRGDLFFEKPEYAHDR